jgi:hypothetical protein
LSDESQGDRREYGTDFGEIRHEPAAPRWAVRVYAAALLLTPFVLLAGTAAWMTTTFYRNHSVYRHLAGTGYGMELHHTDCDVVIYGDSSALVGVIPAVIEQRTGLKTCNIAEVAGIQRINGLMVPDTYVEQNKRPRYFVFLYVPENLTEANRWNEVSTFEGDFFRLQMRPDWAFWSSMMKDPSLLIYDVEVGMRIGVQGLFTRPPHVRDELQGRLPEPGPVMTKCTPAFAERAPDAAWLAYLRQRYGVGGTKVLIDVTPEPDCDETRGFYDARFVPGLIDNKLGTLPIALYANTGRLHVNDEGAQRISEMLADQIARAEKGDLSAQ